MTHLNIDVDEMLGVDSQSLIGTSAAVLGITGSGKSNTAAVLVEELLTNGFPMTIVDIEGEYWGLKEKFEILVAGRGEHADIAVTVEHAAALAELSARRRVPVVLDMSEYAQDELFAFLLPYFNKLWDVTTELRQPYQVVIEEAHEFVPQGARTPLKDILTRIALRGRKRGLATVLISQRSPKVDKDLLTQAQMLFLHRVVHPVDLRVYEDLIPLPARQVDEIVGNLQSGQAIVLYKHQPITATIRLRHTFHAGATPTVNTAQAPELQRIDATILEALRRIVKEPPQRNDPAVRIRQLEQIVAAQKAEIKRLGEALARASIPQAAVAEVDAATVQSKADEFEVKDQAKLFEYFLNDVLHLRAYQRRILVFLIEREGKLFSARDIAKRIDLSLATIESGQYDLLQLGLIERQGKGIAARFASTARQFFQKEFPALDPNRLRETLLDQLMKRK